MMLLLLLVLFTFSRCQLRLHAIDLLYNYVVSLVVGVDVVFAVHFVVVLMFFVDVFALVCAVRAFFYSILRVSKRKPTHLLPHT